MIPTNLTKEQLIKDMITCLQTEDITILQHGASVVRKYDEIIRILNDEEELPENWRISSNFKKLLPFLMSERITKEYQLYHDCGKPYCLEIDDDGKRHFPNHAEVSKQVYLSIGGSEEVANLIAMDMDIHLLKTENIEEFCNRPEWATLILTGISEVHANAEMFGGFDSVSFKIKAKHIDKKLKQILKYKNL